MADIYWCAIDPPTGEITAKGCWPRLPNRPGQDVVQLSVREHAKLSHPYDRAAVYGLDRTGDARRDDEPDDERSPKRRVVKIGARPPKEDN